MKFINKITYISLSLFVFFLWGYFVYDINVAYPSPQNIVYKENQSFEYYGMKVTAGALEICNYDEICNKIDGYKEYTKDDRIMQNSYYILVNIHVENPSVQDISLKNTGFTYWMIESGNCANGVSQEMIYMVDYSNDVYKAGSNMDIELPFYIYKENTTAKSKEELLEQGIKIVAGYYPDKEYIFYGGK